MLQQKRQDKLTSFYEPEPYKVVEKNGSQVLVESPAGDRYKRNVAHTKRFIREAMSNTTPTESEHVENKTDAQFADSQSDDAASNTPTRRSSTRVKRAPERLKDYIVERTCEHQAYMLVYLYAALGKEIVGR